MLVILLFLVLNINFINCEDEKNKRDESRETRYIDLLPEKEKKDFIEMIARRIIEEVDSKEDPRVASGEMSDTELNVHSEFINKLLKQEAENLRRKVQKRRAEEIERNVKPKDVRAGIEHEKVEIPKGNDKPKQIVDLTLRNGKINDAETSKNETTEVESTTDSKNEFATSDNPNDDNVSIDIEIMGKGKKSSINFSNAKNDDKQKPDEIPVKVVYDDLTTKAEKDATNKQAYTTENVSENTKVDIENLTISKKSNENLNNMGSENSKSLDNTNGNDKATEAVNSNANLKGQDEPKIDRTEAQNDKLQETRRLLSMGDKDKANLANIASTPGEIVTTVVNQLDEVTTSVQDNLVTETQKPTLDETTSLPTEEHIEDVTAQSNSNDTPALYEESGSNLLIAGEIEVSNVTNPDDENDKPAESRRFLFEEEETDKNETNSEDIKSSTSELVTVQVANKSHDVTTPVQDDLVTDAQNVVPEETTKSDDGRNVTVTAESDISDTTAAPNLEANSSNPLIAKDDVSNTTNLDAGKDKPAETRRALSEMEAFILNETISANVNSSTKELGNDSQIVISLDVTSPPSSNNKHQNETSSGNTSSVSKPVTTESANKGNEVTAPVQNDLVTKIEKVIPDKITSSATDGKNGNVTAESTTDHTAVAQNLEKSSVTPPVIEKGEISNNKSNLETGKDKPTAKRRLFSLIEDNDNNEDDNNEPSLENIESTSKLAIVKIENVTESTTLPSTDGLVNDTQVAEPDETTKPLDTVEEVLASAKKNDVTTTLVTESTDNMDATFTYTDTIGTEAESEKVVIANNSNPTDITLKPVLRNTTEEIVEMRTEYITGFKDIDVNTNPIESKYEDHNITTTATAINNVELTQSIKKITEPPKASNIDKVSFKTNSDINKTTDEDINDPVVRFLTTPRLPILTTASFIQQKVKAIETPVVIGKGEVVNVNKGDTKYTKKEISAKSIGKQVTLKHKQALVELKPFGNKPKEYNVFELLPGEDPFVKIKSPQRSPIMQSKMELIPIKDQEKSAEAPVVEEQNFAPLYNYAPENAYYNPSNRYGPNPNFVDVPKESEDDVYNNRAIEEKSEELIPEKANKVSSKRPLAIDEEDDNKKTNVDLDYYFGIFNYKGMKEGLRRGSSESEETTEKYKPIFPASSNEDHPRNAMLYHQPAKAHQQQVQSILNDLGYYGFKHRESPRKPPTHKKKKVVNKKQNPDKGSEKYNGDKPRKIKHHKKDSSAEKSYSNEKDKVDTKPNKPQKSKNLYEKGKVFIQKEVEEVQKDLVEGKESIQKDFEEVKESIKKDVEEGKESLQKDVEEGKESLQKDVEEGKESIQKDVEEGKESAQKDVEEGKESIQKDLDEGKESIQKDLEEGKESIQKDLEEGKESIKKDLDEGKESTEKEPSKFKKKRKIRKKHLREAPDFADSSNRYAIRIPLKFKTSKPYRNQINFKKFVKRIGADSAKSQKELYKTRPLLILTNSNIFKGVDNRNRTKLNNKVDLDYYFGHNKSWRPKPVQKDVSYVDSDEKRIERVGSSDYEYYSDPGEISSGELNLKTLNTEAIRHVLNLTTRLFPTLKKVNQLYLPNVTLRSSNEFDAYVNVLRDMINSDNRALENYNWLGTTVDIRSAFKKIQDLSESLKEGREIHPKDLQLLKYVLYLYQSAVEYIENKQDAYLSRRFAEVARMQEVKYKAIKRPWQSTDGIKAKLEGFQQFFKGLEIALDDLHDAIKHIAIITKYGRQHWFKNLKELYLNDPSRKQVLEVILHLFTTRLLGLIEDAVSNGLDDNYVKYSLSHSQDVEKARNEVISIVKLNDELKRAD